tara:strand:+ start:1942 stop:2106 length:165 start_codon:yes stop_codon:yes gene_type:complete
MKIMVLLFFVLAVGCANNKVKVNESYQMEKPYTYPEERNVSQAWPIEPVYIDEL